MVPTEPLILQERSQTLADQGLEVKACLELV